jgi:hypothetical protein
MADQDHKVEQEAAKKRLEEHHEAVKKRITEEKAAREKVRAEQRDAAAGSKPTPTQDENDLSASGVQIELEPDGSPPDSTQLGAGPKDAKTRETKPAQAAGGYSTRTAAPAATPAPAPAKHE